MNKLSPKRQAEYDAMGLPFEGLTTTWDAGRVLFASKAANTYHADQQTIEDLTAKVERLEGAINCTCGCGWSGDYGDLKTDQTDELPYVFGAAPQVLVCPECGGYNSVSED